ncbi:carboxyltransferase domain-containing protein, partial [Rhodococcus hoagii]|nr:carboxyltransferase domain-containing protein [Prescottella equi]
MRSTDPDHRRHAAAHRARRDPGRYDGPISTRSARSPVSSDGVNRRPQRQTWTVTFVRLQPRLRISCRPGFPLHVPRRSSPRTTVPAGAVGL